MRIARLLALILLGPAFCSAQAAKPSGAPTVAEAQRFMTAAETQLNDVNVKAQRTEWVAENFITDDTEAIAAQANDQLIAATTRLAEQARRFDKLKLPPDLARKFLLLKLS